MKIKFTGTGDGRGIPAVGFRCKLCISLFCFFSLFISLNSLLALSRNTQKPKLVVLIAIDAFRYDYLTRFEDHFSTGGFKFLLSQGANFTNTHINHLRTSTGPGHATMLTGASGHFSGIVDNEWWDRNLQKKVNCVGDPTKPILGDSKGTNEKTTGRSPKNLNVTTVGDELRLSNNFKSKVIGISYKDRAAILPSGKLANAAYWFKKNTGNFISSSFYMSELPGWVREFNNRKIPDQYFGRNWDKLLDDDVYRLSRADNFPHERNYKGIGIIFPHKIDGKANEPNKDYYEAFSHSPWADEHLTAFAKAVIENENLGQDDFTDILTISFSATDRIGHLFGPYSVEMQDQVLRIDGVLEKFFVFLDEKIGLDKIAIVLTADHGSGPVPEYMAQFDVEAGRIDTQQRPKGEDSVVIPTTVDSVLDSDLGQADWVEAFVKPNVYLNYASIQSHNLNLSDVENKAAEALRQIKGIAEVFTRTQLSTGNLPANGISQRYLNQFYPERSGDLLIHLKPYFVTAGYKNSVDKGADHETGYDYDTHIPLIIFGKQVKSGTYNMLVNLNDLAPTLATILGVSFPSGNEGRVLFEVLNWSISTMSGLHFKLGDRYLDLYRVGGQHKAEDYEAAIEHYKKGLTLEPDNVYYHNRLGYTFHLERRLKEASREYASALELDPPNDVTSEELELVLKLAPRVYTHADEFFSLEDVVVIVHPEKPVIEYSFFWDDDINFPADNDPTDHEKVWIEYDPESGEIVNVYAYFHRAILSTKEALADARKHNNRARINVQWGGHGSLPVGWETIPAEEIVSKYASIAKPDRIRIMQSRYQEHRNSIRMPDHPFAKEWPKKFAGSWEDYSKFTKYIDLRKIIKKKKMVMKSRWSNAVIDQYFLDYQFFPKIEWPTDVP